MWLSLVYRVLLDSLLFAASASRAAAEDFPFITVASTTSTEQSGLLGYLIPSVLADECHRVQGHFPLFPLAIVEKLMVGRLYACVVRRVAEIAARRTDIARFLGIRA